MTIAARVNRVLTRMLLFQETTALDYEKAAERVSTGSGGHGTHKERGVAPTLRDSLVMEWSERFSRLCAAAERECMAFENGRLHPGRKTGGAERKRRIVEAYEGLPLVEAAFIEGCSTDLVRKTRAARNRNVEDGTRLPRIKGPDESNDPGGN